MKQLFRILALVVCCSVVMNAQDRQQLKEEIDKIIHFDTQISHDAIPGFVIGIIVGDSTFVYGYGQQSKKSASPPDENTLFEIGSATKVFTATLVGLLADDGLLDRDSSANKYLPLPYRNPLLNHITVGHLLTHTSGLPKMPTGLGQFEQTPNDPYAHYPKEALLSFFRDFQPTAPPPTLKKKHKKVRNINNYQYSHVNYALLEVMVEEITQQDFSELLGERVFAKAKMENSFIKWDDDGEPENMAPGYTRSGKEVAAWQFSSFGGSEGIKSSTQDLMEFLKVHLHEAPDETSLSFQRNAVAVTKNGLTENASMGYGWHILHQKKYYDVVLHAGSTSGHRAFIGFVKETKTGVVLLANSSVGTGGLGYLLLRLINFNWKKR